MKASPSSEPTAGWCCTMRCSPGCGSWRKTNWAASRTSRRSPISAPPASAVTASGASCPAGSIPPRPESFGEWGKTRRADGRIISLSLSRLPNGATVVTFTDLTDLEQFSALNPGAVPCSCLRRSSRSGRPGLARNAASLWLTVIPTRRPERFCSALCDAYEEGARQAGWTVRRLTVGLLTNDEARNAALEDMRWATQLIVVYPLWLDQPPALLRDLFRGKSCRNQRDGGGVSEQPVHLVITMDMPAFLYRAMLQCEIDVKGLARGMTLPGFPPSTSGLYRKHRFDHAGAARPTG